jgi:hypothetical protein
MTPSKAGRLGDVVRVIVAEPAAGSRSERPARDEDEEE